MSRLLSLLIGYCFGLFQTSYFYGKLKAAAARFDYKTILKLLTKTPQ